MVVFLNWNLVNQAAARDWVLAIPDSQSRDAALATWISYSLKGSVQQAKDAVLEIADPWSRSRAAEVVADRLRDKDPVAARNWLSQLPGLDPAYRRYLLEDADE